MENTMPPVKLISLIISGIGLAGIIIGLINFFLAKNNIKDYPKNVRPVFVWLIAWGILLAFASEIFIKDKEDVDKPQHLVSDSDSVVMASTTSVVIKDNSDKTTSSHVHKNDTVGQHLSYPVQQVKEGSILLKMVNGQYEVQSIDKLYQITKATLGNEFLAHGKRPTKECFEQAMQDDIDCIITSATLKNYRYVVLLQVTEIIKQSKISSNTVTLDSKYNLKIIDLRSGSIRSSIFFNDSNWGIDEEEARKPIETRFFDHLKNKLDEEHV